MGNTGSHRLRDAKYRTQRSGTNWKCLDRCSMETQILFFLYYQISQYFNCAKICFLIFLKIVSCVRPPKNSIKTQKKQYRFSYMSMWTVVTRKKIIPSLRGRGNIILTFFWILWKLPTQFCTLRWRYMIKIYLEKYWGIVRIMSVIFDKKWKV
jgi:hypothetical protein